MDKSWINAPIKSKTFKDGANNFISFARVRSIRGSIKCPCNRCCLGEWVDLDKAHGHILRYGFLPGYTEWTIHGEHTIPLAPSQSINVNVEETSFGQEDIRGLVRDALGINSLPSDNTQLGDTTMEGDTGESTKSDHDDEGVSYKKLLEECDKELYSGCKYSNLSFTLHLYHIKCVGGISNKAFSMILELLRDAFPHLTALPSSANEAKKFTKDLGLGYEKIHACPNDCMLYWGDRVGEQSCHICKASRYKNDEVIGSSKLRKSNKPAKVLRYFPLIPRLKRLYMSEKTAKDMRWHDIGRTKDGKLRHPADGLAWSAFNDRYSEFASDPRSVRLGLASDGFNPFRTMSSSHSTWPVLLIPYNLPPWICMKQQSFILSSIIPGEKGPGNDIDVYLKPLIKELQSLWKGVDAYDAFSKEHFKLKASLLWTINDFPAYANLSGWSTKGRVACPVCANSTHSRWLKHGKKFCYMGHRRWLEPNHSYRFQKERFDGTVVSEGPPTPLTGSEVLQQKLSACGKKARLDQVHTHTTGGKTFARRRHEFKVTNKRSPNDLESFDICYKTTDDTYIQEATTEMMVIANQEISKKKLELVGPEGNIEPALEAEIAREVLNKLFGNEEPRCFGAGVTKSQITKFCCDLRMMRGEVLANENRFLLEKVDNQSKEIATQKKQLETQKNQVESYSKQVNSLVSQLNNMGQQLNEVYGMLKVFQTAFPDLYNTASTSAAASTRDKQPSSSASPIMDHYSPVMDHHPGSG